jgi:predicted amidophosphoribosyltransferase
MCAGLHQSTCLAIVVLQKICEYWANICDQCAKEYERHDMEHCKQCSQVCYDVQRSVLICNYNNKHIIIFFSIS